MKERMIEMTCPHCGHVFHIKRDTLAIARISENIEKRLQDGTYFYHQCNHCHHLFYMIYPFLFRDPQRKFILILSDKKEIDNLPDDELVVRCKDPEQLVFCYRVLHQQLNLKKMVHFKRQWEKKWTNKAQFDRYDPLHHCLWIKVKEEYKAMILTKEEEKELCS